MKLKIFSLVVVAILLSGCINNVRKNEITSFKTLPFKIGDKATYSLYGKMTIKTDNGFLIYTSSGEATVEIKEASVEDGFGKYHEAINFYMSLKEMPVNNTAEGVIKGMPISLEKNIYRIVNGSNIGGIIKSYTISHGINRDRHITIYSYPFYDIIDDFMQKEFNVNENGSFVFENKIFTWRTSKDKNALRIDFDTGENKNFSIWIKNGYSLPSQIEFRYSNESRINRYDFEIKSFKRGGGNEYRILKMNYTNEKRGEYEKWKNYGVPAQGNNGDFGFDIRSALSNAYKFSSGAGGYSNVKNFINKNGGYVIYATYSGSSNSWELEFGNNGVKDVYVLNVSKNKKEDERMDTNPYLAYFPHIPFPMNKLPDKMLTVSSAEDIFKSIEAINLKEYSFHVSYVERYYPDTLFDIWEGNGKDKEIDISEGANERGACLIDGLSKIVKDYSYGYDIMKAIQPPFISFEGKIDGSNGMILYVYKET